ncbi:helix-turn-helix domain-containing protein [Streptomyces tendae]|uniref:TetR/AcrR family transcriptional regulator n=1 Tax=Streptomyces tendae TaxID=1932 RepID=UPI00340CC138
MCAAELFAARCFGRVTVSDIAPRAGVSLKTVFASVGSMGDILEKIVARRGQESGYGETMARMLAPRRGPLPRYGGHALLTSCGGSGGGRPSAAGSIPCASGVDRWT